jgi:thioredoxin 1
MNEHAHEMKTIPEINQPEFEAEVLKSQQPVLVSFWAGWSQPCRVLGPTLDKVAARCEGRVKVVKVNADDNFDLGLWYDIQFIPTLLYFINGSERARIVGTASTEAILARLQSASPDGDFTVFLPEESKEHEHRNS